MNLLDGNEPAESPIDFDGRLWTLQGATMSPKPVQTPHPPVWFGGSAPAGMRRAARHGDGFMGAGSQTTAAFRGHVAWYSKRPIAPRTRFRSASASTCTSTTRLGDIGD